MDRGYEEYQYEQEKAWGEEQAYLASESAKAIADAEAQEQMAIDKEAQEVERVFREFWAGIVLNKDGSLNLEQAKKELYDFKVVMGEVCKVYDELTMGRFSKPNTASGVIIDAVNEVQANYYKPKSKPRLLSEEEIKSLFKDYNAVSDILGIHMVFLRDIAQAQREADIKFYKRS